MNVTINGKPETIREGQSVETYLDGAGLGSSPCAVEINKVLVPKRDHPTTTIHEGDSIEIVTLVGGG